MERNRRRRERVGQREGIDLLIDRVYEATYGGGFEDALPPARVGRDEGIVLAA